MHCLRPHPNLSPQWEGLAAMSKAYEQTFTATAGHIDELGHVNNAVWVTWI